MAEDDIWMPLVPLDEFATEAKRTTRRRRSKEKIVTVCLANRARSPTAEWLLHRDYKVKSCGTAEFDATKPCDQYDMKWANRVLVMEPYQKANLEQRFPAETAGGKVEVLDVPEVGKYSCQPSLIDEIAQRLREHHLRVRDIRNLSQASSECIQWTSNMADRKMRGRAMKSRQIMDYIQRYGEFPPDVGDFLVPVPRSGAKEPWQIEEERAFARASAQAGGQGGITRMIGGEPVHQPEEAWASLENLGDERARQPRVTEDERGMQVWMDDKELTDEAIDRMIMGEQAPKEKKQKKLTDALKEYAESVKEFFK